jgi:hypothetical protein
VTQLANQNLEVTGTMTITETVEARIHVPSGAVLVLVGVTHDGVLVTGGGYAHIAGETQTLTVTVGGRAVLTGTCHGPLINDGGEVIIEGVVEGPITEYAGQTVIAPTATVHHPDTNRTGQEPAAPVQTSAVVKTGAARNPP